MKKVKIGVLGAYRGGSMIKYCKQADNAEVVAICDKSPKALNAQKKDCEGLNIAFYDNFDDFIQHDMDAVVLANYAHQHAPFAIRAMKMGKHVFSEVLPVQTLKEAVALIETVEETGMIYAYGENYCYMPAPYEMRRLYREGKLGEFEYGEGEYIHNCETIWPSITYGERDHWRNFMYTTFYCTHSLGPIIHITGLRPVSVIGFEGAHHERRRRVGCQSGAFGMQMVTLENGGIVKSIHGDLYKDSIWYTIYGAKGRMESAREDAENGNISRLYVNCDEYSGEYATRPVESYEPKREFDDRAQDFGHGNSDFYTMWHFVEKILGNPEADIIDVYEAVDMYLPGLFSYMSILEGGVPKAIPNLRNKEERDIWRNNTACSDKEVAGDMLFPPCSEGEAEIPDSVYEHQLKLWEEELARRNAEK